MNALAGYTGFVGSNIYEKGSFDAVYNSKNIEKAYGTNPDLLIYAGLRAEKYLADHAPLKDMEQIIQAEENIRKISPKKLVLISTIDVFRVPRDVDEASEIEEKEGRKGKEGYGANRYQLELWVRERYPDALIIRLPALYGKNMKKNFLYDYIHVIPSMLQEAKFQELCERDAELKMYYVRQENGFYKVNVQEREKEYLKEKFRALGFSALHFTDSRSIYQFYSLERLYDDIQTALKAGIFLWHAAVEPVSAGEVYQYLTGRQFHNELSGIPAHYDYKTRYAEIFGGSGGYICRKEQVLEDIKGWLGKMKHKSGEE